MLEIISEREFLLSASLTGEYELNNTGPLFCFADIVCHFLTFFRRACSSLDRWATTNDATGSDKRTILITWNKNPIYEINFLCHKGCKTSAMM